MQAAFHSCQNAILGQRIVVAARQHIVQLTLGLQRNAHGDQQAAGSKGNADLQGFGEQVGQGGKHGQEESGKQRQAAVGALEEVRSGLTGTHRGDRTALLLDQGYWPDGLYTPASDEAMVADIMAMKELGFNMLRKHIKIEPLRWYYHCDRLGMLVWQDMVNGGGKYDSLTVVAPLFTGAKIKDDRYARFSRSDEEGREQFKKELDEMIAHLYNCVSIAVWVPFNEGWGQFDAAEIAGRVKTMDPTRLIDHASGWHDQGAGDIYSRHVYFRPYRFKADDKGRAAALTECGGYSLRLEDSGEAAKEFGYKKLKSREELMAAYRKLYEQEIIPAIPKGLSAVVYTQLSDVEGETNGLLTYDREILKVDGDAVREINSRLTYAPQGESES